MAAVTICSDSGTQKNKVSQCFHCFPIYFPLSDFTKLIFSNYRIKAKGDRWLPEIETVIIIIITVLKYVLGYFRNPLECLPALNALISITAIFLNLCVCVPLFVGAYKKMVFILNSTRVQIDIPITPDVQMTPPLWQKVKRNSKASWWKWKWRVKKLA